MFMPVLCKSETFIVLMVKIGLMIKILRLLMITFDLGSIFVFFISSVIAVNMFRQCFIIWCRNKDFSTFYNLYC